MKNRYWVIDVEGNGGSPPEIIEIALLEVDGLKLTGLHRHWLVHPLHPIQARVSRIHGLTDADVVSAPRFQEIERELTSVLGNWPIIGHHVRTEVDVLTRSIPTWQPVSAIDTMRIAKVLKPNLHSYSLEHLGSILGYTAQAAQMTGQHHHSALFDATLTALIFVNLLAPLSASERELILRGANVLSGIQQPLI